MSIPSLFGPHRQLPWWELHLYPCCQCSMLDFLAQSSSSRQDASVPDVLPIYLLAIPRRSPQGTAGVALRSLECSTYLSQISIKIYIITFNNLNPFPWQLGKVLLIILGKASATLRFNPLNYFTIICFCSQVQGDRMTAYDLPQQAL